jgi:transglutaminase-like putative cysteine protease
VTFRLATLLAVVTGIVACAAVGEISAFSAIASTAAVAAGMAFSYLTRSHPWGWVKVLLALAVLGVFVDFVLQVFSAAHTGELSSIEVPLAGLFTWVQVVHAFDVPARRDLLFSIAAGAALVTVAAAQALSAGFLVYVAVWLVASIVALACSWRSMSGGAGRLPVAGLSVATVVVVILAVAFEAVLPPPRASQTITLPNSVTSSLQLFGGGLTQGGSNPREPAKAGSPSGPTRVGGFVGFAGPLDTAIRGQLGNEIVLRVRADRPGYFLGQTYDEWNGQSWLENAPGCQSRTLTSNSPFDVSNGIGTGTENIQTFYVEQSLPNLLFATSTPQEVYFPAPSLILGCDHSIRSTIAMTPGTVYTVISSDSEVSPSVLLNDHEDVALWRRQFGLDLQLPHPYPRAAALARSIVRHARNHTIAGTVLALESWIGDHTTYSTNIPPLAKGQDAVDEFLFGTKRGFCEQISTALAVMLRSLGIPAREATGYVPGSLNPLSDLYEVKASDAHAWVQVYMGPSFGWQSFDPTTYVPLSPSSPGTVLLHDIAHDLASLPWAPLSGGVVVVCSIGIAFALRRRRLLRPATRAGRLALRLERIGARAGLARAPAETLGEYRVRLWQRAGTVTGLDHAVRLLEQAAYAGLPLGENELSDVECAVDRLERIVLPGPFQRLRAAAGLELRRIGRNLDAWQRSRRADPASA